MPRCHGVTRSGQQCRRNAVRMGRCRIHSGVSRQQEFLSEENISNLNSADTIRQGQALQLFHRKLDRPHVEELMRKAVMERILFLFFESESVSIRDGAIWALINITAVEGTIGIEAMISARPTIMQDIMQLIIANNHFHHIDQMFWCLSNIAGSDKVYAESLIALGAHNNCIFFIRNHGFPPNIRRNAAFLLSNIAKYMNSQLASAIINELSLIPPIAFQELYLLTEFCWCIHSLVKINDSLPHQLCALFVELIGLEARSIVSPALNVIEKVCNGNNRDTINTLLRCGLCLKLHKLLKSQSKNFILFILSNIAVEPEGSHAIINTPGLLLDINECIWYGYGNAIWTVANLANAGDNEIIDALLRCGSIHSLLDRFQTMQPTVQQIALEGLVASLEKGQGKARIALQSRIHTLVSTNLDISGNQIITRIQELLALPTLAWAPAAEPIVDEAPPPRATAAAFVALGRLNEALIRGGEPVPVDVSDLLFVGADVAYLMNNGCIFNKNGQLVVRN